LIEGYLENKPKKKIDQWQKDYEKALRELEK
jgi:hypothetical protein